MTDCDFPRVCLIAHVGPGVEIHLVRIMVIICFWLVEEAPTSFWVWIAAGTLIDNHLPIDILSIQGCTLTLAQ